MRLEEAAALFESEEFPTTRERLCSRHGDLAIELADGEAVVTTVLERAGDERYGSYEELRASLFCGLPAGAVGRRFYSDRNTPAVGEDRPTPVSF
ncbi:DUF2795 domain-containing protein [Halobaculum sp. MBLA0143]|uniref:DUF5789 family protein n=1 Tax=Halobaculum sp. MBLA0143 TaxID=3079933 RepID=UPI003524BBCC